MAGDYPADDIAELIEEVSEELVVMDEILATLQRRIAGSCVRQLVVQRRIKRLSRIAPERRDAAPVAVLRTPFTPLTFHDIFTLALLGGVAFLAASGGGNRRGHAVVIIQWKAWSRRRLPARHPCLASQANGLAQPGLS
jgi:hypothetical protein